ncbi:FAD:protein FMN transferase [Marinospirillum alkaliphilum]|uniref:FAD:protein FMN transferase n=1 Tax=Marinospirillum alkaliphilum DSM 21637 TaxID=1122209 RepID=A0A1K1WTZ3_9GAMM|nr:FAD:protein FMN transferase [Marinospirillum alkaliphilum]SFX40253.1 thiamine biosynthesis lipoprotein [Marinospirillum alkaliphilum DSM 21637]
MLISKLHKFSAGLLLVLLMLLLAGCGKEPEPQPVRLQGQIFGTFWLATFPDQWSTDQVKRLETGIKAELDKVNQSMSTYLKDSELNRFNAAEPGEWVAVSTPLFEVLSLSQAVSEASRGAFDVTVGGLVNLWSFGPEARPEAIPGRELLQQRKAETGYRYLELDYGNQQARRLRSSYVDLSGVAKGYAVDRVADWLKQQGVDNFLVNIGGDLIVAGERNPGQPWRIGVEVPDGRIQVAHHILPVSDMSVATSGDYRNYYEVDGRRMSHTIDPRTGWPVNHQLASVTVLHPSNAVADAWATAFMVLGTNAALELANREKLDILLISREGDGWKTDLSESMRTLLGSELSNKILSR